MYVEKAGVAQSRDRGHTYVLPADWTVSHFFGGGLLCQDCGVMTAACGPWPASVLGTVAALCWAAATFSVPPL